MKRFHKEAEVRKLLEQKEIWIAQTIFVKPDLETTVYYTQIELNSKVKEDKKIKDAFSHCYRSGTERIRVKHSWSDFYQQEIDRLKAKGIMAEFQYNSKKEVRVIRRLTKEEIQEALDCLNKVNDLTPNEKNYILVYLPVRIKMVEEDSNRIGQGKKKVKQEEPC